MLELTELCQIGYKYGTDKCPQICHTYTPFYHSLFKDKRQEVKKVFELGIGGGGNTRRKIPHYQTGASLRMWRDYFPNAWIYGIDIKPGLIFQDERITTWMCNGAMQGDMEAAIDKVGRDIDIFIDDGSHHSDEQVAVCKTVLPLLSDKAVYVIEDVFFPRQIAEALKPFRCEVPVLEPSVIRPNTLMLVTK